MSPYSLALARPGPAAASTTKPRMRGARRGKPLPPPASESRTHRREGSPETRTSAAAEDVQRFVHRRDFVVRLKLSVFVRLWGFILLSVFCASFPTFGWSGARAQRMGQGTNIGGTGLVGGKTVPPPPSAPERLHQPLVSHCPIRYDTSRGCFA